MTIIVNRPGINFREELNSLKKPSGIFGERILRTNSSDEFYKLIGTTGRKNMIINGDMRIDQRLAGASYTADTDYVTPKSCDHWRFRTTPTSGVFTIQRVTDAPPGFLTSLKATVTTADTSITSDDRYAIGQGIEGTIWARTGWGTADPKPITISFWVKSNIVSAHHSLGIMSQSADAGIAIEYSINSPGVWEYKTITVQPPRFGTWNFGNNVCAQFWWCLAMGDGRTTAPGKWDSANTHGSDNQINLMRVVGNYIQITGVQVELGTTATPFEHLTWGESYALCQRYFWKIGGVNDNFYDTGATNSNRGAVIPVHVSSDGTYFIAGEYPVEMRGSPTITTTLSGATYSTNPTSGTLWNLRDWYVADKSLGTASITAESYSRFWTLKLGTLSSGTASVLYWFSDSTAYIYFESEF